ncbi:MAG: DUF4168 domain-containing protein [Microcoleaceae cyanobacterium MO_207.B10]|nr:DUF4168 domain-containing protein [Microcoleaceae cyanobacterium MO_207.B10]
MNMKILSRTIQTLLHHRLISRSLLVATLSTMGVMIGVIPKLSDQSLIPIFETAAYAQKQFTNQEINKYANAVLQIEKLRVGAYQEVQNEYQKQTPRGEIPEIICNDKKTVSDLPQNIQVIAVNYCDQAKRFIESNDLTVAQFNEITMTQKDDQILRKKIQDELIRIQKAR